MHNFVVISGCSGGGKSSLIEALRQRGHAVVPEPGRRIVAEQLAHGGQALPWADQTAFAHKMIAMAHADRQAASGQHGWVFFDRSVVDAAAYLDHLGDPAALRQAEAARYHPRIFLTPPWPEIYRADPERRHDFDSALAEYARLERIYPALGYAVMLLPRIAIEARVDFLLANLD